MKIQNPKSKILTRKNYLNIIIITLLGFGILTLGFNSFAQTLSIGFIDVQKVFKEYKETSKAQKELSKKEETFRKEFAESQKKLDEAQKAGKSVEEVEKIRTGLEEKLAPKRTELLRLNEQLTTNLQKKIVWAVEKVAKKLGIEMVLDKQVVITGGSDLTDMVVSELNR